MNDCKEHCHKYSCASLLIDINTTFFKVYIQWHQFRSVTQLCPTLCMDCSTPELPCPSLSLKLMSIELVLTSNHLILCCPLLLLPSVFPSIRVFSNLSVLHIRWPKYWSFSFSISPSNEYSGLISFRMDWFDLFGVQGLSRVSSNITVQKH